SATSSTSKGLPAASDGRSRSKASLAASSLLLSRPTKVREQPSAASAWAMAKPMPPDPPVISALRPLNNPAIAHLQVCSASQNDAAACFYVVPVCLRNSYANCARWAALEKRYLKRKGPRRNRRVFFVECAVVSFFRTECLSYCTFFPLPRDTNLRDVRRYGSL